MILKNYNLLTALDQTNMMRTRDDLYLTGIKRTNGELFENPSSSDKVWESPPQPFVKFSTTNVGILEEVTDSTNGPIGSGICDIVLGKNASGTVSYENYTILGTQITEFEVLDTRFYYTVDTKVLFRLYKNTSANTVTVNELGLLTRIAHAYTETSICRPVLLSDTILENPVTVLPGEMFVAHVTLY